MVGCVPTFSWLSRLLPLAVAASSGCGQVTADVDDGPDVDASAAVDAAPVVDAGVCEQCDPEASCDVGAPDPCRCRPGYVGDGTSCTDVVAVLHGARQEVPCTGNDADMTVCSTVPATPRVPIAGMVGGPFDVPYRLRLRVRGVVEKTLYAGGATDGFFNAGGARPDDGFSNVYRLSVETHNYFFNAGDADDDVFLLDYTAVIDLKGGDTFVFAGEDPDNRMERNGFTANEGIVVPAIPPAPDPFNGQFVQLDVVAVEELAP